MERFENTFDQVKRRRSKRRWSGTSCVFIMLAVDLREWQFIYQTPSGEIVVNL